jgi:hypothetical protein
VGFAARLKILHDFKSEFLAMTLLQMPEVDTDPLIRKILIKATKTIWIIEISSN